MGRLNRRAHHPTALLFDLDGCLVDSLPSIARCWAETLPAFGFPSPSPDEIRPHIGPPVDHAARKLAPGTDEPTIAAIVAAYRRRSAQATDVQPYAGMPELIDALTDRGVVLAIATSKSMEVVEPLLERLDLRRRFVAVAGTPVDELGADKTTVVGRVLGQLDGARPYALVGDRHHDVHGAHAHGLKAIGALWGYGSEDELRSAGADMLVAAPADVARLADRIG